MTMGIFSRRAFAILSNTSEYSPSVRYAPTHPVLCSKNTVASRQNLYDASSAQSLSTSSMTTISPLKNLSCTTFQSMLALNTLLLCRAAAATRGSGGGRYTSVLWRKCCRLAMAQCRHKHECLASALRLIRREAPTMRGILPRCA